MSAAHGDLQRPQKNGISRWCTGCQAFGRSKGAVKYWNKHLGTSSGLHNIQILTVLTKRRGMKFCICNGNTGELQRMLNAQRTGIKNVPEGRRGVQPSTHVTLQPDLTIVLSASRMRSGFSFEFPENAYPLEPKLRPGHNGTNNS